MVTFYIIQSCNEKDFYLPFSFQVYDIVVIFEHPSRRTWS